MSAQPEMSCAACLRKLVHVEYENGSEDWLHSINDESDHPPRAVPEGDVATIYSCDFCRETPAEYRLPVEAFDQSEFFNGTKQVLMNSGGDWATCWSCAALVESDQWRRLLLRVITSYESRIGKIPTSVRAYLWDQLLGVRAHVTGHVREN